jgi:hypothetical protein
MPDEFPTLEVVALIGVIAALVGMLQIRRSMSEIPKLGRALERALRAGDLAEARALCGRAEGAAFARIGLALIEALGREPAPAPRELKHVITAARKRAAATAQRGRARDLVVSAVLIGAGAYAIRASLGVGSTFYGMLAAALFVTALGPVLRRSLLNAMVRASDGVFDAATAYLAQRTTRHRAACAECHSESSLRVGAPALDAVRDLGLTELFVCRSCGLVRGRVERPEAIQVEPARGIELTPMEPPLESSAEPGREHHG